MGSPQQNSPNEPNAPAAPADPTGAVAANAEASLSPAERQRRERAAQTKGADFDGVTPDHVKAAAKRSTANAVSTRDQAMVDALQVERRGYVQRVQGLTNRDAKAALQDRIKQVDEQLKFYGAEVPNEK